MILPKAVLQAIILLPALVLLVIAAMGSKEPEEAES
jgi:hypothetical protein